MDYITIKDDTTVIIHIIIDKASGKDYTAKTIRFEHKCTDNKSAVELREQLYEIIRFNNKKIARNCLMYLGVEELNVLKETLKKWDSKNLKWKPFNENRRNTKKV